MVRKPALDRETEAARWFVRWSDANEPAGVKEQSRWIAWLQRSPRHVAEYFAMDDMCARLSESGALQDFDVDEWMAKRRAPIVGLHEVRPRNEARAATTARRSTGLSWGIAAIVAVVVLALFSLRAGEDAYRTGIGEQKTVHLTDGSMLQLNTRSQARVSYSDGAREIELQGEALFTVAKDSLRPFLVRTRDATVRAIGTRFNVYEQYGATRVVVLEGRVRVSADSQNQSFELGAGEGALVTKGIARKETRPNVKVATAWQSRTLVFERARLADVAREFNRYNTLQFRIDPTTGETNRLSGTFDARHPESLLLWLKSRKDLAVRQDGANYVVETAAAQH